MLTLIRFLLIVFTLGKAEDSGVFGDHFEHVHSQSAKDLSSFLKTQSDLKMNLRVDDVVEAFHSVAIKNRHFSVAGHDREKSVLAASSNGVQHLFRQTNSTLQLHNLWISLTDPSTILSFLDSSSLLVARTTISTAGTNNLVTACPSTSYGLSSSVSITFSDVRILTQSGVVPSFVGVSGQTDSKWDASFDVSMNVLSQTLDSVKLIPQGGIFVSSPTPTERWSDLSTSVLSSGCRFTNISSVPTASPNMPHHSRTRYTQLISGMDMTQSEHGLYGLVSSDINSGGDFLFKNTSFSHCTTTQKDQDYLQGQQSSYSSVTEFDTCTFTSMTSTTPGAAISRAPADTLTLVTCSFTQCESTVAQFQHGGALFTFTCNHVELSGTNTFDRCVCRGGAGGGFFIYDTATTLTISGVTCVECWNSDGAGYYGNGGGGYLRISTITPTPVQITNCEFAGCTSTTTAGLSVSIPWTEISSCQFTDCEGNGHERGGGLNYFLQGTHTLAHCTFTNCSHLTGVGGGIASHKGSTISMDSITFTNCHTLNAAGGACHLDAGAADFLDCWFIDCNISLNSASSGGGALFSNSSTKLHLNNTHFVRCKALKEPAQMSLGGGLFVLSCTNGMLHLCTFTDCVGGQYGGGASLQSSTSVITNCTFTDCTCRSGGGMDVSRGKATLEYCVFERCSSAKFENAGQGGGGLHMWANNSVLNHVQFIDCEADGVKCAGLIISDSNYSLNDVNFTTCVSKGASYGSGLFGDTLTNAVITNSLFISCTSEGEGGGAYLKGTDAKLENCTFQVCQSGGFGAALKIELTSCEITGCVIDQCISTTTETAVIHFENTAGTLTITNTNITKSTGTGTQGGVLKIYSKSFVMSTVEISDSTLNSVSPSSLAQGAAGYIQTVSSDFSNCRFEKCTSGQRAGALFFTNSGGTLTGCVFDTCIAEGGNGGAVEIDGTSSIAFVSCVFKACSAGNGDGGGLNLKKGIHADPNGYAQIQNNNNNWIEKN
ncbi:hypothetical protein BLNAU_21901 [Blattamonas nauphoetae]|uniref:Right handed beta helix domain-containing protein n=1 Tax=Blattamonas nauphoetae TaxID=2049346 RepID=A0ABQ9WV35_9EUKA|nr:hypothetical protein BLNAU_21901 [Blattamonas nauphoetae]